MLVITDALTARPRPGKAPELTLYGSIYTLASDVTLTLLPGRNRSR